MAKLTREEREQLRINFFREFRPGIESVALREEPGRGPWFDVGISSFDALDILPDDWMGIEIYCHFVPRAQVAL